MTKESAIALAIENSKNGVRQYVRDDKGLYFVNDSRVTEKGVKWLGTAKDGKYRTAVNIRASIARKERESIMRDCGLVKVKGALGGTYWE